jgi:hypothetical protein
MVTSYVNTGVGSDLPTISSENPSAHASAVSWGAIFAGATAAAALSLILLMLGIGLGLSSVSPWVGRGASATSFGVSTIVWVTFTQIAAAGMGGYLAGRLRTRWANTHIDEVYFRDTAHGFLAWALATVVTAAMLTSAIGSIVSGGAQAAATVTGGAAKAAATVAPAVADAAKQDGSDSGQGYFVDFLFRKDTSDAGTVVAPAATSQDDGKSVFEVGRIMANAVSTGTLAVDDTKYVGQMVSQRTGMPQAEAEKKVSDTFARMQTKAKEAETAAREAADKARKASAYSALWLFVSLLIGAFCASLAGTYGGRRRDLF